ncbi:gp478 [Bacillus phage G]|uniref:Gp478 n=1 Tax=Bacillus phage G TaxID=2884420 RepID=G3MAL9_9CAUD|nr:gp478 [Bacillus phage G]AEO93736.1 gp478 [Bacillus phage G]
MSSYDRIHEWLKESLVGLSLIRSVEFEYVSHIAFGSNKEIRSIYINCESLLFLNLVIYEMSDKCIFQCSNGFRFRHDKENHYISTEDFDICIERLEEWIEEIMQVKIIL